MYTNTAATAPQSGETLDNYIKRLRTNLKLSQQQLATTAGIHLQSLGKLERGKTNRLNQKTKKGLAVALSIPEEYLDAVVSGMPVPELQKKQFCPRCWHPGTKPDPAWTITRAKHCLICGTQLRSGCRQCGEPIAAFEHRFCPHCGCGYSEPEAGKKGASKTKH